MDMKIEQAGTVKRILHHIRHQPFVFTVGLAALVHSTWSLGTAFSGNAPDIHTFSDFMTWVAWVLPAFLIAFSFDVGQIVTSAEIRDGEKNWTKYATFVILAGATYYLQWLYMAHHIPLMELGKGVRSEWAGTARLLSDAAIWIVPALLPMSTLLYTFSHTNEPSKVGIEVTTPTDVVIVATAASPELPEPKRQSMKGKYTTEVVTAMNAAVHSDSGVLVTCPYCGQSDTKENAKSAQGWLTVHLGRYCKVKSNGHVKIHADVVE